MKSGTSHSGGPPLNEEELHAYVDDWLPGERREIVERYCTDNPDVAKRVRAYEDQNRMLHQRFDPVLEEEVPSYLPVEQSGSSKARSTGWGLRIAAAVGWLTVGSVVGWVIHGTTGSAPAIRTDETSVFVKQAMLAHSVYATEPRHTVEVRADQEAHLIKWLSNRLGQKILVPDLKATGYHLVGGRLLPSYHGGVAAQFMYEDEDGDRCSLYLMTGVKGNRSPGMHFVQAGRTRALYWIDATFGYVMAGDVEKDRLMAMAKLAYHQLSFSNAKQSTGSTAH